MGKLKGSTRMLNLCAFISAHQHDWTDLLPCVEFALNNHANLVGLPFSVYGHHPVPFPVSICPAVSAAAETQQSFNSIWADVSQNLHLAASKYKVAADRHRPNFSLVTRFGFPSRITISEYPLWNLLLVSLVPLPSSACQVNLSLSSYASLHI